MSINEYERLCRDWVAKFCLCVFGDSFFFFGGGGEEHINKLPPQIPGQSHQSFVYVSFLRFLLLPANLIETVLQAVLCTP